MSRNTKIHFQPDNISVDTDSEATVLDTSLQAGLPHVHTCGGKGRCSTCRIMIIEGLGRCTPRTIEEKILSERLEFSPNIRLACQTKIEGAVTLRRLVIDDQDEQLSNQLEGGKAAFSSGEEKKIAILFADIEGFTPFSEALPPYDVMHLLNRYFHQMVRIIEQHGGYVDNYMGDGLLALFGIDKTNNPGLQAVRAGKEMLDVMESFQDYLIKLYRRSLNIRIGIHYGSVVIGVIGACERKRKTAVGDDVNIASRIEAANKGLGTTMLISEPLYGEIRDAVEVKRHRPVRLKGKSENYFLFEVLKVKGSEVRCKRKPENDACAEARFDSVDRRDQEPGPKLKPLNVEEARHVLNTMVGVEKAMASLYNTCAECWQEDKDLWRGLVKQEISHAKNIVRMRDVITRKAERFEMKRNFTTAAMKTFTSGIKGRIEQVKQGAINRRQMLFVARDIERSLLEAKYAEIFKTNDEDYLRLLAEILEDTAMHRKRIEEKLASTR